MNALRKNLCDSFKNLTVQRYRHFSCCRNNIFKALLCCNSNVSIIQTKFTAMQDQDLELRKCRFSSAGTMTTGVELGKVVAELEAFAPKSLAESWDNVGLLVEPASPKKIRKALLTIDLTESVMEEALSMSVDLIISYHPPIFAPLKSITMRTWKERLIAMCLENRVAMYSPHTSYDAKVGGVNDWLAAAFDTESTIPLTQSFKRSSLTHRVDFTFYKCENVTSDSFLQLLRREHGGGGNSLRSTRSSATDSVTQLTLECSTNQLATITKTFSDLLPPNMSSSMSITKVEQEPMPGVGMGRLCKLTAPVSVKDAIELVKRHIGIPHLRLALAKGKDIDSKICHVALCAGSGGSILRGTKADLWLTGEMQHHDVLEATQTGTHVILCNHSDSERGYLKQLAQQLFELFSGEVTFHVSANDRDPLKTV